MTCRHRGCDKPAAYKDECRDCYEDRLRREARSALDKELAQRREDQRIRTRYRRVDNYDGPEEFTRL